MSRMDFSRTRLIGMIHVGALPGTPCYEGKLETILERVALEARIYREEGADAVLVENMHDRPYLNRAVGPEITAAMTRAALIARSESGLPTGIQILAGANQEALAVALAAELDFIRAEGFVFSHVADEGLMNACAGELLRYRRAIGATHVSIYADIKKKHSSHAITSDVNLPETAHAAEFFGADGLVVTGVATGCATDAAEVQAVVKTSNLPVFVGSGVDLDNLQAYVGWAHGLIVGSHFKTGGRWDGPLEACRVHAFAQKLQKWNQDRPLLPLRSPHPCASTER